MIHNNELNKSRGKDYFSIDIDVQIIAARFSGDSYVQYVDENYEILDIRSTQIAFNFSTIKPNGMILWTGEVIEVFSKLKLKINYSKTCHLRSLLDDHLPYAASF